jgi:hypothetical protein
VWSYVRLRQRHAQDCVRAPNAVNYRFVGFDAENSKKRTSAYGAVIAARAAWVVRARIIKSSMIYCFALYIIFEQSLATYRSSTTETVGFHAKTIFCQY